MGSMLLADVAMNSIDVAMNSIYVTVYEPRIVQYCSNLNEHRHIFGLELTYKPQRNVCIAPRAGLKHSLVESKRPV